MFSAQSTGALSELGGQTGERRSICDRGLSRRASMGRLHVRPRAGEEPALCGNGRRSVASIGMTAQAEITASDYIRSGSKKVNGWLAPESARLVKLVSESQARGPEPAKGSVGEIGVHHGRLFILLYLLAEPNERAFAIDIFEAQHLNVDGSGEGDRTIFEGHLRRIGADMDRIDILAESSLEVSADRLRRITGPVRLFSVDGGHTTPIALNDLALAEATLVDGGVVILDDVFQSLWPGVSAALARYLLGGGRLVPFAVCPEKVLLTQPEHRRRLMLEVSAGMPDLFHRNEDFFGHEVALIRATPPLNERVQMGIAQSGPYQRLRHAPIVRRVIERARPTVVKVLGRG